MDGCKIGRGSAWWIMTAGQLYLRARSLHLCVCMYVCMYVSMYVLTLSDIGYIPRRSWLTHAMHAKANCDTLTERAILAYFPVDHVDTTFRTEVELVGSVELNIHFAQGRRRRKVAQYHRLVH